MHIFITHTHTHKHTYVFLCAGVCLSVCEMKIFF